MHHPSVLKGSRQFAYLCSTHCARMRMRGWHPLDGGSLISYDALMSEPLALLTNFAPFTGITVISFSCHVILQAGQTYAVPRARNIYSCEGFDFPGIDHRDVIR